MTDKGKPLYMIGVVADMLKVHPQTLRMYEKKGLIRPSRSEGRTRMYSADDVDEVARVIRLARDLGVNLAGIEIILKMRRRMLDMQTRLHHWLHAWLFIHVPFSFLLLMLTFWHAYVTLFYY